jgi:cytosine deaminase
VNSTVTRTRLTLRRARVAPALLAAPPADSESWAEVDIEISDGLIARIAPSSLARVAAGPAPRDGEGEASDLAHGIVMPAFVDCHAHLDKAHLADRRAFPAYGLLEAIEAMDALKAEWTETDLRRRVEFSLATAFAHGVRAIRSHVDWGPSTPAFVWPTLMELRALWADRVELQLAPLSGLDDAEDPRLLESGLAAAYEGGGVIGFFVYRHEPLAERLSRLIDAAAAHGLDLDFHVDEGLDPQLHGLETLARLLIAKRFPHRVLCGHCVALSLLAPDRLAEILALAKQANIAIVTLPHTNLALQERHPARSPVRRGMAPIREIAAAGIPVAIATDNVRDGFYAFGDHDPLEALALAADIAHLPDAALAWQSAVTTAPAAAMGLAWDSRLAPGAPADLVLFEARTTSELMARRGRPRRVLRAGRFVDTALPSFRALDADRGD